MLSYRIWFTFSRYHSLIWKMPLSILFAFSFKGRLTSLCSLDTCCPFQPLSKTPEVRSQRHSYIHIMGENNCSWFCLFTAMSRIQIITSIEIMPQYYMSDTMLKRLLHSPPLNLDNSAWHWPCSRNDETETPRMCYIQGHPPGTLDITLKTCF